MYVLGLVLMLFAQSSSQQNNPTPDDIARMRQEAMSASAEHRRQAIELNEQLGHIRSEADSRVVVDAVAKMLQKELPPAWSSRSVRRRIARAEYAAVSDPTRLIPEQRIADVWNEYVREIGASDEVLVTVAEIHNMRDAQYAGGEYLWTHDINRNIWTMPNVSTIGPDGKIADGCRALEALRVMYELDNQFENLRSARERVQKGIVISDEIKKRAENRSKGEGTKVAASLQVSVSVNPLHPAEWRYIQEHSFKALNLLLDRLYNRLFPE